MNPESPEVARTIFLGIRRASQKLKRTQAVICPPAIFFGGLAKLASLKTAVGVQNLFWESKGPFTGEFSAVMAANAGARYAILGHSERRELGENSEMINKKILTAVNNGLIAILCVGEKERDAQGNYLSFIKQQLTVCLSGFQKRDVGNIVIAYEPVWAIGKSDQEAMKGGDVHEMLLYIRKILTEMFGREYSERVPILYGGSVSSQNTLDIVENGKIDGLLVGRQSLDPVQFKEILSIVDSVAIS